MNDDHSSTQQDNTKAQAGVTNSGEAKPAASINVHISEDKLECRLRLTKTAEGKMPQVEDVQKALADRKIAQHTIINDALEDMFSHEICDKDVLVASGTPPVDGEKGIVKYFFLTEKSVERREDEQGRVDFKQTGFVKQVKKDDVLAEVFPPKEGKDGVTVTGEVIEAKKYEPTELPAGKNTAPSDKNPNQLVAQIDGLVSLKSGRVNVDPVLTVDGDVDYETGNIDFNGTVFIKGGVKSGFSVKAAGDITIREVVEDAQIESQGNIILKGGFIGSGEGKISAEGNVSLPFAENQYVYAAGDVRVSDALLHSTVEADGRITVSGKKGVVGGMISANDTIETYSAGSDAFTKTVLRIGLKREVREKMEKYKTDAKNNKANTIKIDNMLAKYEQLKKIKKTLPENERAQYAKILKIKNTLIEEAEALYEIKQELDDEYKKFDNAQVKVKDKVYPGVIVEIGEAKKTINELNRNLIFKKKEDIITSAHPVTS